MSKITNKGIFMYYFLSTLGILLGLILAIIRVKNIKICCKSCIYILLCVLLFFIISKIFSLISYGIYLLNRRAFSLIRLLKESGFIIWGAILGFSISSILFSKKFNIRKSDASLFSAITVTTFHWLAKLGCFYAGCCYGVVSKSVIAIYPLTSIGPSVERIPVQLIESIIVFFVWCVVISFSFIPNLRKHALSIYLFIYSLSRFILEFYRGDSFRGKISEFYFSQWISIFVIIFIIIIYGKKIFKIKVQGEENEKNYY